MKLLIPKLLLYALITACYYQSKQSAHITSKIDEYLTDPKPNKKKLRLILESGSVNGVFSSIEVQQIFEHLSQKNQDLVKIEKIGQTFLKKDIKAYHLSGNGFSNKQQKSQILFTGVHHAREIVSAVMVVKIYLECLHSLIHSKEVQTFWKFNDLVIVPILNLDSFHLITTAYGTDKFDQVKYKRKNMNNKDCITGGIDAGVDLNRNYGYHYSDNKEGNNPCSEEYRGAYAFSEPETQAVQNLVDQNPNIVSAMNFHTYGNMWIHPFNYLRQEKIYPENINQKFIDFYEEFGDEVQEVSPGAQYGNAIEMVKYSADGEASDWMLGEKNIIAFSPELGSSNQKAQDFYIPKDLIFEVIEENFNVIQRFLERNIFGLTDLDYGISKNNEFFVQFKNSGLADLINAKIIIKGVNQNILSKVNSISYHDQYNNTKIVNDMTFDRDQQKLIFTVDKISRLEDFKFSLKVENLSTFIQDFELNMTILMYDDSVIDTYQIKFNNYNPDYQLYFVYFLIGITISTLTYLTLSMWLSKNKKNNDIDSNSTSIKQQIIIKYQLNIKLIEVLIKIINNISDYQFSYSFLLFIIQKF